MRREGDKDDFVVLPNSDGNALFFVFKQGFTHRNFNGAVRQFYERRNGSSLFMRHACLSSIE